MTYISKKLIVATSAFGLMSGAAWADQVIADDLIVQGSICVGQDCVNGESFGFDTLRMKENNLRIRATDTSASASFPTVDWQLTFNDSGNGGLNKFAVDNIDLSTTPFTIESGSNTNALYVDDGGRVGFGTDTPVVQLHVQDGNTPTLRLEQDGSSGFTSQSWDVAGNEANFFVRDATNGSTLPFRIQPGAPSSAIYIADDGNVGMGAGTNPEAALHVEGTDGTTSLLVEERSSTTAPRTLFTLRNNGSANFEFEDTTVAATDNSGRVWKMKNTSGEMLFTTSGTDADKEMSLSQDGDLTISGNFVSGVTTLTVPDYVFADDYKLRPLAEVRAFIDTNSHLPEVPSAKMIGETGLNMSEMQLILLKKVEELTLYTLEQDQKIAGLTQKLEGLAAK